MPRDTDRAAIAGLARRVLRYGGVGVAISLIYSLAVIACMRLAHGMSPTLASVLAFLAILPVAYRAHATISFSDRGYDRSQPWRFALSSATSFAIAVGGMYWITEIEGRGYLLGIAWNWLVIPGLNFVAYLFWVFRAKRTVAVTGIGDAAGDAIMAGPER